MKELLLADAHQLSVFVSEYETTRQLTQRLDVELDFITDVSPLELASEIVLIVREVVDGFQQSLGTELEFDVDLRLLKSTRFCVRV